MTIEQQYPNMEYLINQRERTAGIKSKSGKNALFCTLPILAKELLIHFFFFLIFYPKILND
jgi:hypothetical protein